MHVGVEVGLLLGGQQAEEGGALAPGGVGLDELAAELGDGKVVEQRVADGGGAAFVQHDLFAAGQMGGGEDVVDEAGVVLGDDAEGVAGLVHHVRAGERKGQMDGLLAGDVVGQVALVDERGVEGMVAGGACGLGGRGDGQGGGGVVAV